MKINNLSGVGTMQKSPGGLDTWSYDYNVAKDRTSPLNGTIKTVQHPLSSTPCRKTETSGNGARGYFVASGVVQSKTKEILFDESDYVCIPSDDNEDDNDNVFTNDLHFSKEIHGCLRTIRGKVG